MKTDPVYQRLVARLDAIASCGNRQPCSVCDGFIFAIKQDLLALTSPPPDELEARRRPEPGTDGDMRQEIEDLRCLLNTRPILSKFHGLRGFELEKFIEAYSKWTDAVIEFTR